MSKYTASDMVQLPRLTGTAAMALGEQLLSAARPHKTALPTWVARALTQLRSRHRTLKESLRDQVSVPGEPGGSSVLLDRALDGCWGALDGFLGALSKLPPRYPQAAEAAEIRAALLPGGLTFLSYAYVIEWTESELRLQRMRKAGLDARIEALGGGLFLEALADAHAAYGKGLGVTAPGAEPAPAPPGLREPLDAFTDALRDYVIKVRGMVDPRDAASRVLADRLIAPLENWSVGPQGRSTGKPAPAPEPPPASEPAPASTAP